MVYATTLEQQLTNLPMLMQDLVKEFVREDHLIITQLLNHGRSDGESSQVAQKNIEEAEEKFILITSLKNCHYINVYTTYISLTCA